MTPEEEAAELKLANAVLLKEKADAVARWHEEVRASLKTLASEIATVKLNTNELPQIRANQESHSTRIRSLEDRWIIIVAVWVMTVLGFILYVHWRLPS